MEDITSPTGPYEASQSLGSGPVLALAAHPGDEFIGCGGAIIRHVSQGDAVHIVVVSDGAPGGDNERLTLYRESHCASALVGFGRCAFWALPLNGLEYGEFLVERIRKAIESTHARLVYSPSWSEAHSDHLALAVSAAEAVRRSDLADALAMYELGSPLCPNRLLDISALSDRKQAAIRCFQSRIARQAYDRQAAALNQFRTYGLPRTVLSAEAYLVLDREALRAEPVQMPLPRHFDRRSSARMDRPEPLVSVLVHSMNRDVLIEQLDSVALQTYPHIEILVIDGTGGQHRALPSWWGRFPLRLIPFDMPPGLSTAANRGLSDARGKLSMFLDESSLLDPDHISTLVGRLSSSGDKRCVYSGVRIDYIIDGEVARSATVSHPFQRHQLRGRNYIPIHSALFHRSLYEEGCRFDETLDALEDWDFWLQLLVLTDFIHVDKITSRHRCSVSSGYEDQTEVDKMLRSTAAVFEKWRTRWSGMDWAQILLERDRMRDEIANQINVLRIDSDADRVRLDESQRLVTTLSQRIDEYQAILAEGKCSGQSMFRPGTEAGCRDPMLLERQDSVEGTISRTRLGPIRNLLKSLMARSSQPPNQPIIIEHRPAPDALPDHIHPPTPMLHPRHLLNARLLDQRGRILELVTKGSIGCEVGVGEAVFTRQILNDANPSQLHLIDINHQVIGLARTLFASEIESGRVQTHLGDSAEVLMRFPPDYLDWVYLDTTPAYEHVKRELDVCRTRVKNDGWIIVHNYIYWDHVIGRKYGVVEATHEFCLEHDYELLYLALHSESFNDVVIRRMSY
jgi:LmbE family N-acetylglucosaminyl deacetylase